MKKTKKILSLVLAVLMLVSVMPMAYAEGNKYKVGDIIQFGEYPQTKVKSKEVELIAELNALAPEWDEWTSYNYYINFIEEGYSERGDEMRYTDITYNGEKYRGVKFTQYRADFIDSSSFSPNQKDNGYNVDTVYWFKFEPIEWRVLDPETGLVISERILDVQPFNDTHYNWAYKDSSCEVYASNYEFSSIREWLNDDFYNLAFSTDEQEKILTCKINNKCYYTSSGITGYEEFDANPTEDKIRLFSAGASGNSKYGFSEKSGRQAYGTAYAKCQGLYIPYGSYDSSSWWLRSAYNSGSIGCVIDYSGNFSGCSVQFNEGIRPAFRFVDINNFDHKHDYKTDKTPATCTTDGYTTFTCDCGDTYVDEIIKAPGHSYNTETVQPTCKAAGYTTYTCDCGYNYIDDLTDRVMHKDDDGDYKCDYGCGLFMGEGMESSDPPCNCKCHKGGIAGFFWKIANFFNRLFKIKSKQMCACGVDHY